MTSSFATAKGRRHGASLASMGGATSEIQADTKRVLLRGRRVRSRAAFVVAGVATLMHTESSHRFERGVDPGDVSRVLDRAVAAHPRRTPAATATKGPDPRARAHDTFGGAHAARIASGHPLPRAPSPRAARYRRAVRRCDGHPRAPRLRGGGQGRRRRRDVTRPTHRPDLDARGRPRRGSDPRCTAWMRFRRSCRPFVRRATSGDARS